MVDRFSSQTLELSCGDEDTIRNHMRDTVRDLHVDLLSTSMLDGNPGADISWIAQQHGMHGIQSLAARRIEGNDLLVTIIATTRQKAPRRKDKVNRYSGHLRHGIWSWLFWLTCWWWARPSSPSISRSASLTFMKLIIPTDFEA